jgi:hypothetical protein
MKLPGSSRDFLKRRNGNAFGGTRWISRLLGRKRIAVKHEEVVVDKPAGARR